LSPENQPSRRLPVLTTLVLILFYDGGVEFMVAVIKNKKIERKDRQI